MTLSKEIKQKLREEAKTDKSRYKIARELGISPTVVYKHSKDIPTPRNRQPYLRGRSLDLLKQILNDGYIYTKNNSKDIRKLQTIFPMIKRSQFKSKSIYYLEEKNKQALQEMININKKRVIKYRDLTALSKLFNVKITSYEKEEFYGRKSKKKIPIIRRKDGGFLSSYSKYQTSLDDY
jgi:hypothetical protein